MKLLVGVIVGALTVAVLLGAAWYWAVSHGGWGMHRGGDHE